jgi:plastocyanin
MNKYLIALVAIIILVSVLVTGYLLFNTGAKKNLSATTPNTKTTPSTKSIPTETVTLTSTDFQPQTLTIKQETRVVWINTSGTVGAVNSDNYPTNLLYPFLNFGQFNNGSSFSTIFSKTGTYTYYNFLNQNQRGKIIVE